MSVFGKSDGNTKDVLSISGQGYATGKDASVVSGAPGKGADAKKKPSLQEKRAARPPFQGAKTLENREYIPETVFRKTDRVGYGGGFKIPEEYRKKRESRRLRRNDDDERSSDGEKETNAITKEEIISHLNLGDAQMNFGSGQANSKGQLTKDLVEGLEKELEKLKRSDEHYRMRMRRIKGDKTVDETEKDVAFKVFHNLEKTLKEDGGHIQPFGIREEAVQLLRHQPGQLKSVKNEDYDALEAERMRLVEEARQFEELMYAGERTKKVGSQIRKTQGYEASSPEKEDDEAEEISPGNQKRQRKLRSRKGRNEEGSADSFMQEEKPRKKSKKRVTIQEDNVPSRPSRSTGRQNRSRSKSQTQLTKTVSASPRRTIYEAKFEKYVANKNAKQSMLKRAELQKVPAFDITTKNQDSPSKWKSHYPESQRPGTAQARINEDDLMPEGYEDYLVREDLLKKKQLEKEQQDPFKQLGVSKEDKMVFFLLKWVFNAIRQPGDPKDHKLKGKDYIDRKELVRQLAKNTELMHELEFDSSRKLWKELQVAGGAKPDVLTWEEYLNFFFLRNATLQDRVDGNDWWNKVDKDGKPVPEDTLSKGSRGSNLGDSSDDGSRYGRSNGSRQRRKRVHDALLTELQSVKMTPALEMLIESRKAKTIEEVEANFNAKIEKMAGAPVSNQKLSAKDKNKKKKGEVDFAMLGDQDAMNESLGFHREKSKNLLLPSQVHVMKEIYEALDKYSDGILQRSNLIMRLRTDERVVDFVDAEAVQVAGKTNPIKILTLDQVLAEIESDEMYERMNLAKGEDDICHKEFITWREFLTYFDDYREADERNKKAKQLGEARKNIQKSKIPGEDAGVTDPLDELKSLMEQEKERRLKELPRIRPADMIDISEDQLKLIKDIYIKQLPKDSQTCHTITFFAAIRKSPQMKAISSAVARDPEGHARMQRETFQQVFDRMERDIESKHIEWSTIVEFFTKRGKPLSKEEIERLQMEDLRLREEQEEQRKREEEAEQRKLARMDEDLAEAEDFDAYAKRQAKDDDLMDEDPGIKYNLDFPRDGDDEQDRSDRSHEDYSGSEYGSEEDRESYESDDDLERADNRASKRRSKGSKSKRHNSTSLRDQRVSGQDFDNNSKRKGKYGVTVPLPFNFDSRDMSKPKTIRERKVEAMVKEKQAEEEARLNKKFQSKPVPPEVSIPRYDAICEANERRRETVRRNSLALTQKNEQPFSFWDDVKRKQAAERDPDEGVPDEAKMPSFKANPIPIACSMSIYKENLERESREREQRVRRAAEISKSKSSMPPRMQRDMDRKSQLAKEPPKSQYSFKPKINPSKTSAEMLKAQQKFQASLEKKKGQFTPTQPSEFNFSVSKSKAQVGDQFNEGSVKNKLAQAVKGKLDPFQQAMARSVTAKSIKTVQTSDPPATRGVALQREARRKEIDAKRAQEEKKVKEDKARQEKQQRLKMTVQAGLKGSVSSGQAKIDEAAKQKREDWKKTEAANKEILRQAIEKGRSQPMLTDTAATSKQKNLAMLRATRNFLDSMEKAGIGQNAAMRTLTEEQKDALAEDGFVQAQRMKKLGIM